MSGWRRLGSLRQRGRGAAGRGPGSQPRGRRVNTAPRRSGPAQVSLSRTTARLGTLPKGEPRGGRWRAGPVPRALRAPAPLRPGETGAEKKGRDRPEERVRRGGSSGEGDPGPAACRIDVGVGATWARGNAASQAPPRPTEPVAAAPWARSEWETREASSQHKLGGPQLKNRVSDTPQQNLLTLIYILSVPPSRRCSKRPGSGTGL